ncbi:MAG: glycosyltransferase family 2 protein [Geobacteraceae bacterium]|nr:glycosyltransferase family 2 protein [Geobacteraceae bacterium]
MEPLLMLIFWSAMLALFYTYAGYPLVIAILARRRVSVARCNITPIISVVIAARNEASRIGQRLENLVNQAYPGDRVEIIVVSDGSTDQTNAVVTAYADKGVTLIETGMEVGKAAAVNVGVAAAHGEIIVFADARQRFAEDVLMRLVANFNDEKVGCVSGELLLVADGSSSIEAEMGAYWRYEKWLRKNESDSGSTVGATGAIFAIRRHLFQPLPNGTILDDLLTPLNVVRQGYRSVFDSSAVAYDSFSKDAKSEWCRKVRTLSGNWQLLSLKPDLLLPWKNPLFFRFVSHKLLRLVMPAVLLIALITSLMLQGLTYRVAAAVQVTLYGAAIVGLLLPNSFCNRFMNLCKFFLLMNAATVSGFWHWMRGRTEGVWVSSDADLRRL